MAGSIVYGARYPMRVAAAFESSGKAYHAAATLVNETDLSSGQIEVIDPRAPVVADRSTNRRPGVTRTLVRLHLLFGSIGLLIGLSVATGFIVSGATFATARPLMVVVTFSVFSAVIGLLFAGLVAARPVRHRVIAKIRNAATTGHWTLVAYTATQRQRDQAHNVLKKLVENVRSTD